MSVSKPIIPLNSSGLCMCGCGSPAPIAPSDNPKWGHIKGQPQRYIHNHHSRKPVQYVEDPETGCWIWQLALLSGGYGLYRGKYLAHRLYWETAYGPIPDGMQLDHLCRNRACVNPAHLEVVTAAQNNQRGMRAKLTWNDVHAIRADNGRTSRKVLAERYGVHWATIGYLLRGDTWKEEGGRR